MVKIPKAASGRKVLFFDKKGKFVAESERYQKATRVLRLYRRKFVEIYNRDKPITPTTLANLINRDEFEALAPNFAAPVVVTTNAKKFTAWSIAEKLSNNAVRGLRGKAAKVTLNLRDGDRLRKVTLYHRFRKKGPNSVSLFKAMNHAIGQEGYHLYNRLGSKLLPDRKGQKIHLQSVEISIEL